MLVRFKNSRSEKLCVATKELQKKYGQRNAEEIQAALVELEAASHMEAMPTCLRPHPLSGDRKGQYAVDLVHPFRLIFEPTGTFDRANLKSIVEVQIIELCINYH